MMYFLDHFSSTAYTGPGRVFIAILNKVNAFFWTGIYFLSRSGLSNTINDYERLKICVVCVGNF